MRSFLRLLLYFVMLILLPISAFGQMTLEKVPPNADDVFKLSILRVQTVR